MLTHKNRIKKIFVNGLILTLILGIIGCSETNEKVTLLFRTGDEGNGLRALAERYTQDSKTQVVPMEIGRAGYFSNMPTQLLTGSSAFDIVVIPSTMVAQFAEAGVIHPMDTYVNDKTLTNPVDFDVNDFLQVYRYKGKLYALPFTISTHFLYYRSDLIKTPPNTWDEVYQLARKFSKSTNPQSPTEYGLAFSGLVGEELPKVFYSVMWSHGGWIVDSKGKVGLDSAGSIEAAEFWAKLKKEKLISPEILSMGFAEVKESVENGTVAMAVPMWDAAAAILKGPHAKNVKLAMVPGIKQKDGTILRSPFNHGWALAINAASKNPKDTWRFLAYGLGKEGSIYYFQNCGNIPARKSTIQLLEQKKIQTKYYVPDKLPELMIESISRGNNEPAVTYYSAMHEAMNVALTKILNGVSPKTALDQAAQNVRELQSY